MTDKAQQAKMVISLVRLMKHFGTSWNGDNVECDTVLAHLQHIAGGKLPIDREQIKALNIFQNNTKEKNRNNRSAKKRKKSA